MDDLDRIVRDYGNEGFGGYGSRAPRPVVPSLPQTTRAAAVVDPRRGDAEALSELLKSSSSHVREAAVEALAELSGPPVVTSLIEALGDGDPWVRRAAAHGLGALRSSDATDPLRVALTDGDIVVREAAATALRQLGADAAPAMSVRRQSSAARSIVYPIRKGVALRVLGVILFFLGAAGALIGLLPHFYSSATWSADLLIFAGAALAATGFGTAEFAERYLPPEGIKTYLEANPDSGGVGIAFFAGGGDGGGGGGDGGGGGGC
jgi:VIT1/CCC1 family predicted Fe2+/Mn2+ transporter